MHIVRGRVVLMLLINVCCNSNEIRAVIANPPKYCTTRGHPYHSSKLHVGLCSSVGMRRGTDTQTDTLTTVVTIHFASAAPHAKCNNVPWPTVALDSNDGE